MIRWTVATRQIQQRGPDREVAKHQNDLDSLTNCLVGIVAFSSYFQAYSVCNGRSEARRDIVSGLLAEPTYAAPNDVEAAVN